jgi:transcriptional regulator of acetoin/glycerol metabolism
MTMPGPGPVFLWSQAARGETNHGSCGMMISYAKSSFDIKLDWFRQSETDLAQAQPHGSGRSEQGSVSRRFVLSSPHFPIAVPPLRERRQDIMLLTQHLLRRVGEKMKQPHLQFAPRSLQRLMDYHWPGNATELQNIIERAVILSRSTTITVDEMFFPSPTPASPLERLLHIGDLERAHVLNVLDQTNWRIYGDGGSAQLLGLNPETLRGRIRKLGIRRPSG